MQRLRRWKCVKWKWDELLQIGDKSSGRDTYSFDKELYEKDLKQIAFEEGEHNKLIALVQKKLQRGDSVEKIADDLMESNETITGIIDMINK